MSEAATLSACAVPVTAFSPRLATCTSSSFDNSRSRRAFTTAVHAAAVAPLLPSPRPWGTPFSTIISKPFFNCAFLANSAAGGPAEFFLTSTGILRPSGPRTAILIFFPEVIRTLTLSEYLFKAKHNRSNLELDYANFNESRAPDCDLRLLTVCDSVRPIRSSDSRTEIGGSIPQSRKHFGFFLDPRKYCELSSEFDGRAFNNGIPRLTS